jgi:dipeptidyl aminopeptidase/acylaminoacyl peptidase
MVAATVCFQWIGKNRDFRCGAPSNPPFNPSCNLPGADRYKLSGPACPLNSTTNAQGDPFMRLRRLLSSAALALALGGVSVLAGCASAPTHPALQGAELPPLIPARQFFANTRSAGHYQVSPDGRQLAWIGVWGAGPALFVKVLDSAGAVDRMVGAGVGAFQWAADSRHVFVHADRGGNENTHVLMFDTAESDAKPVDLTPGPNTRAFIHRILADAPQQILVLHNRRDARIFDLVRIDLRTRAETLVLRNPGDALGLITDDAGEPVGLVRKQGAEQVLQAAFDGIERAREVARWPADDLVTVLGPDPQRRGFYLLSNRGRDRRALVHLDASTGAEQVLAEDDQVDIEGALFSRVSRRLLFAWSNPGYQRVHWLDAGWERDVTRLLPTPPRRLALLSSSLDEQRATLMTDSDTERRFWLLDRRAGTLTPIGDSTVNAYAGQLGLTKPIALKARDGLALNGYLTLPPGRRANEPGPMVLLVHGGPWARDHWDLGLGGLQFLVNRGYAVLQVNYRGSYGYGRRHMEAAIGEFAGKMHDDLLDAVQWAVAQRVADPRKVAIMGASYGGYATLVGLSFTPDTFACGVDMVGVSNWVTLVENFPAYWGLGIDTWHRYLGNPAIPEQRAAMFAKSPISRVDDIRRPLLVIQTGNDVRVRQDQSDTLVAALRARGQPVEYQLYPNAGHLSSSWSWGTRLRAYRAVEDFLGRCLGGRNGGTDLFEAAAWLF